MESVYTRMSMVQRASSRGRKVTLAVTCRGGRGRGQGSGTGGSGVQGDDTGRSVQRRAVGGLEGLARWGR